MLLISLEQTDRQTNIQQGLNQYFHLMVHVNTILCQISFQFVNKYGICIDSLGGHSLQLDMYNVYILRYNSLFQYVVPLEALESRAEKSLQPI